MWRTMNIPARPDRAMWNDLIAERFLVILRILPLMIISSEDIAAKMRAANAKTSPKGSVSVVDYHPTLNVLARFHRGLI